MSYKPTQSEKNEAYGRGIDDARKGKFNPPKGDPLVDFICAPLDALAGTPSTKEVADGLSKAYRDGHYSGSNK
jgi:hypothetical protein